MKRWVQKCGLFKSNTVVKFENFSEKHKDEVAENAWLNAEFSNDVKIHKDQSLREWENFFEF